MRRRILPVISIVIAGAIAGCTDTAGQQLAAAHSVLPLIQGVCDKGNPYGNAVVLIALTKQGKGRSYLCDKGYAPGESGKPEAKQDRPPGQQPVPGTAGSVDFEKYALPGAPDPCLLIGSGGSKTYACW